MTARPCLKWAGGKHDSVPAILGELPDEIGTYREPFFGGGAVFFALAAKNRFRAAVLSDSNCEVMAMYAAIRDDVGAVIAALQKLNPLRVTSKKYYRVRASRPRSAAAQAARTLFLNHLGFNGLYRVNKAGKFNVPWNHQKKWAPDYENLRAVAEVLRQPNVSLHCCDFAWPFKQGDLFGPEWGQDAAYFDPPYLPESKTARFAAYTSTGFSYAEHKRLGKLFEELSARGVHCVASNADVRGAAKIYEEIPGTELFTLGIRRAINSKGSSRGKVGELLIVNRGLGLEEVRKNVG
jgi:DNA adenine methylase